LKRNYLWHRERDSTCHGGRVANSDGVLAEFSSTERAVIAALALRDAMAAQRGGGRAGRAPDLRADPKSTWPAAERTTRYTFPAGLPPQHRVPPLARG
jgi:hypothetical protein